MRETKTLEIIEKHLACQNKIRTIFTSLEAFVRNGRTEKEIYNEIEHFLKSKGYKSWHPLVVKSGENSIKKGVKHIPNATDAISDLIDWAERRYLFCG
jgi:Xaa-Pro aminopeptidase